MLSSHSQNLINFTDTENIIPSTRKTTFKTPARALKRGRAVHDENSVYGHPRTVGLTGRKKNVLLSTPGAGVHLQSYLKTEKAPRFAGKSTALAEITNQTPFIQTKYPITPGPGFQKTSKPFILLDDSAAPSTRRISSTRKKARLPRSASKSFETPETRGNHWDVSDVSIEASVIEENSIVEEDYDDVEYGPSTAIEPTYDPGFDMPNYKEVGATLLSLLRQGTLPEDYDPVSISDTKDTTELEPVVWERLELPEIPSDDIFPFMEKSEKSDTSINRVRRENPIQPTAQLYSSPNAESTQKPSAPVNSTSKFSAAKLPAKPTAGRSSTISHTRIPSLSKVSTVKRLTPIAQPPQAISRSKNTSMVLAKPTAVPPKSTSRTHARATSMLSKPASVLSRPTNTVSRPASALSRPTSVPPRLTNVPGPKSITTARTASVSKSAAKPVPTMNRKTIKGPQSTKIPDDTVLSLFDELTDGILEEDFLFEI